MNNNSNKSDGFLKKELSKKIGLNIKNIRRQYKLSGKELSKVINISQQQLSRYENGFSDISAYKLYLIALYFCVDFNYFLIDY